MIGPDEKTYFFDEVRDGFFIPSMTKKCWAVNYKNLSELRKTCADDGVTCFGMWGTMLGAIRHGGNVPWDDDMDTAMIREGFNHLLKLDQEKKLPGEHWLVDYEFNNNDNMTRGWVDTGSLIRTIEGCKENFGFPLFDTVDIFILDTIPRNEDEKSVHRMITTTFARLGVQAGLLAEQKKNGIEGFSEEEIVEEDVFYENLKRIGKSTGLHVETGEGKPALFVRIYRAMDEYCSGYKIGQGDEVTIIPYYLDNEDYRFSKKLFSDYIEVPFEYGTMPVPIGYDSILRRCYGRYMYPVFAEAAHGYPFYREYEKDMRNLMNIEYVNYHFNKDEYAEVMEKRTPGIPLSEVVKECVNLLCDAHNYIQDKVNSESIDETLFDVLGQCQELAVSVGERVETSAVEGDTHVKSFENYCNDVYVVYQLVESALAGENPDMVTIKNACQKLATYEDIFNGISSEIKEVKQVVLLCYRSSHWESLHSIYEALSEREDSRAIVIRVPYYLKNYDGTVDKENMVIEDGYPEGIEFTDYDKYDFENNHPAAIIQQWPYDEYNESVYLHPYYHSKNLCTLTDNLVFIPPFLTREIRGNDRLKATLAMFVDMPGLIYADTIIAQSEEMKEELASMLDEFVSAELSDDAENPEKQTLIDFEKKVVGTGSAIYDVIAKKRILIHDEKNDVYYDKNGNKTMPGLFDETHGVSENIIERLKKDEGGFKKILAFYVSGSMLFDHGKPAVDKMKRVLDQLTERKDILVWWYMDPYARDILRNHDRDTWNEFRKLRDDYAEKDLGVLDESWNDEPLKKIADMFYGDACPMLNHMRERGCPVLWETPGVEAVPDGYERKQWNEDTVLAVEDEWSLENFLEEAVTYEKPLPSKDNGIKIAQQILG